MCRRLIKAFTHLHRSIYTLFQMSASLYSTFSCVDCSIYCHDIVLCESTLRSTAFVSSRYSNLLASLDFFLCTFTVGGVAQLFVSGQYSQQPPRCVKLFTLC